MPTPVLQIRLDDESLEKLKKRATAVDLKPSAWARAILMKELAGPSAPPTSEPKRTPKVQAALEAMATDIEEANRPRTPRAKATLKEAKPANPQPPVQTSAPRTLAPAVSPKRHSVTCSCGVCVPAKK